MIIGISGHFGAGKDAIADVLIRRYGFKRLGFADALKDEVLDRLPRTLAAIGELAYPELSTLAIGAYLLRTKPPVIRALLQEYGTEVRRRDRLDYWLDKWEERHGGCTENLVVPDVRFRNEAEEIKRLGGWMIRVERPGHNGDDHPSERSGEFEDFRWDDTFHNDQTLGDLERRIIAWYEGGFHRH